MPTCTIVVPCFNEASRLDLRAFVEHAARYDHRFVFVNDGSDDETGEIINDLADIDANRFSALHLTRNMGKAEAVRRGVSLAFAVGAKLVGYWDADLATPLDAITEFQVYLQNHPKVEFLLGSRVRLLGRHIDRHPARHLLGRVFATVAAAMLRLPVYDTQCGAKMFRSTPTMQAIFRQPFRTRWLFDVELIARFLRLVRQSPDDDPTHRIHELPLIQWRDVAGSKVKPTDFFRALWQLGMIHRLYGAHQTASEPGPELRDESVEVTIDRSDQVAIGCKDPVFDQEESTVTKVPCQSPSDRWKVASGRPVP